MARRTSIFVLAGAFLVGATALLFERTLIFSMVCGTGGAAVCSPHRTQVLGLHLSPSQALMWSIVLGAIVGGFLGLLVARASRRKGA